MKNSYKDDESIVKVLILEAPTFVICLFCSKRVHDKTSCSMLKTPQFLNIDEEEIL